MKSQTRWVIVTGISGSGRTTALRALEDLGYYCVDNLPAGLLPQLHAEVSGLLRPTSVAVGIDVRGGAFLEDADRALDSLQAAGVAVQLLFLDCADDVLVRRFTETRRRHPVLAVSGRIGESIERERRVMLALRERTSLVIDTSESTVHDLKRRIRRLFGDASEAAEMLVGISSFGFKHGSPRDADYMFDVRCLPNPHFVPDLRPLTGLDERVSQHVLSNPEGSAWLQRVLSLLDLALPLHEREGRALVSVAVGCTGGQHRSVAMAEAMADHVRVLGIGRISVHHRDVSKMSSS